MAEYLGHKRLNVYQKGMPFASMRKTLLDDLPRCGSEGDWKQDRKTNRLPRLPTPKVFY
jgi:hypothetical protein